MFAAFPTPSAVVAETTEALETAPAALIDTLAPYYTAFSISKALSIPLSVVVVKLTKSLPILKPPSALSPVKF